MCTSYDRSWVVQYVLLDLFPCLTRSSFRVKAKGAGMREIIMI